MPSICLNDLVTVHLTHFGREIYRSKRDADFRKYYAGKPESLKKVAKNPNTVFVPFKALDTLGLSQKIFAKEGR